MPRLARFSAGNDTIDVRPQASVGPVHLAAGSVDVDIRYGAVLPSSGVATLPLPDELLVGLRPPDLARSGPHPTRTPEDLRHRTLIHSGINLMSRRGWAKRNGDVALDFEPDPRFDRSSMAIGAAVDGLGICLEGQLLAQREIRTRQLLAILRDRRTRMVCHSLSVLKAKQNVPKIRAFFDWMFTELGEPLLTEPDYAS